MSRTEGYDLNEHDGRPGLAPEGEEAQEGLSLVRPYITCRPAGGYNSVPWKKWLWARRVISQYNRGDTRPFPPEPTGGWRWHDRRSP
jgi:hypothetical protein